MNKNSMPYSLCKNDNLFGTIVSTNHNGVKIRLDIEDILENVFAFAYCSGEIGQKVLVSVQKFNDKFNNFRVTIDSYLTETTPLTIVGGRGTRSAHCCVINIVKEG